jgi:hypothetical protein
MTGLGSFEEELAKLALRKLDPLPRVPGRLDDDGASSDDLQGAILDALADGKPHSPREVKAHVVAELGGSWKKVQRAATRLERRGGIVRDHADEPSLTAWRSLDTTSLSQVTKDSESLETLGQALFGHPTERGPVQSPDRDLERAEAFEHEYLTDHQ